MWGSGGFWNVPECPGIPNWRKSQPEVSKLYRRLLECHFMTWRVFLGFLVGLIGSWWHLRGSGGYWGVGSFFQGPRVSFEVLEGWEVLGGSGGVPKKLMGVKVFKVSWSATLWPEGSCGSSRRVLYDPSNSKILFFSMIQNANLIWRYPRLYCSVRRLWVLVAILFMSVFIWMAW